MKKIRMIVKDLKASRIKTFYDLILLETDGARALSVSIGENEADNIALILDKIEVLRPVTYDVFTTVLNKFNIAIKEIIINKFYEGTFYACAVMTNGTDEYSFDMRVSDAVNMALRTNAPVYASENIINDVGFDYCKFFGNNDLFSSQNTYPNIDNMSIFGVNMLQDLLKDAINKEDYITASILRDKIKEAEESSGEDTL